MKHKKKETQKERNIKRMKHKKKETYKTMTERQGRNEKSADTENYFFCLVAEIFFASFAFFRQPSVRL
jgi:hypothetical protein